MNKLQGIRITNVIIIILLISFGSLTAQTVDKFYVNMPDGLNPTLSKQNRMELLEYHKAGSGDSIANRFANMAYLVSIDTLNNYLVVKNTPSSTFELKMLTVNDSTPTIAIIRTVCGSICQSSVEFYDTAWHIIPLQFSMPKAVDWLNEETYSTTNLDKTWIKNVLETSFISLSFDKTKQKIIAKNNTLEFLSETDKKVISPLIDNKVLKYNLVGKTWVLEP